MESNDVKVESIWVVYADGACSGNPGPGGWAFLAYSSSFQVEVAGSAPRTTNNRMELQALLEAFLFIRQVAPQGEKPSITVRLDSQYVLQGITQWIYGWKRRNFVKADGSPVANADLWEALAREKAGLSPLCTLRFEYVAGHSGEWGNDHVDRLAVDAAAQQISGRPGELATSRAQGDVTESVGAVVLYDGPRSHDTPWPPHLGDEFRGDAVRAASTPKSPPPPGYPIYLSLISGHLRRHKSWSECESVVKGAASARYKKVSNPQEEAEWLSKMGISRTGSEEGSK